MAFLRDGELAIAQGIPQLDRPISRTRHDLPIIGREGNRENVIIMADKSSGRVSRRQLPETKGLVPRGREGVGSIRGDDTVRDDVRVTFQSTLRVSVGRFIPGQVPDHQSLVSTGGQKHIGTIARRQPPEIDHLPRYGYTPDILFKRGREAGDPATMTLKGAF